MEWTQSNMTEDLTRRKTDAQKRPHETEAEIRVMLPQTKGVWKLGEARKDLPETL